MEGAGSGRGTNIYAHWRLRVRIPLCTCVFFVAFWCFGGQVAARAKRRVVRGRTGESCEFGGWPQVACFVPIFFDACFAVYNARRLLGSKTWISATLHRQGPRMVSEARNACFGITGARNRPIPTLLPSETCTQTPLDRPKRPNKAPQVTYLSGVLEADRRATDPADAAPAAAPSIAPGSAEPDGVGVPKTPRHGRPVAGEWGRHVPTTAAKLSVCVV